MKKLLLIFAGIAIVAHAQLIITPTGGASAPFVLTLSNAQTQTNTITALGTTPLPGLQLQNTTAAAAGAQQVSPSLRLSGRGWRTNSTAESELAEFQIYVVPVQGATNPTSYLTFDSSINGASFASALSISSSSSTNQQVRAHSIVGTFLNADGTPGGNAYFNLTTLGLQVADNGWIFFGSGSSATGGSDTAIKRSAAGVIEINSASAGVYRDLKLRTVQSAGTTYAALPTASAGMISYITDGATGNCADGTCTTFGTNVTGGGGSLKLAVWYNGSNWTLMGK